MNLTFRETRPDDIEAMFSVRARTRQNPASEELLASYGITPASTAADMASGKMRGLGVLRRHHARRVLQRRRHLG